MKPLRRLFNTRAVFYCLSSVFSFSMNLLFSCRLTHFHLLSRKLNLVPGSASVFLYANFTQLLRYGSKDEVVPLCKYTNCTATTMIMMPIAMQVFMILNIHTKCLVAGSYSV